MDEEDWLSQAAELMTYENKGKTISGISGNTHIYAMLDASGESMGYQDFSEQNASMAIADLRAAADSQRNFENGRGFMTEAYPVTNYTDLVQYIALDKNIAKEKIEYALEFISIVLNDKTQTTLCDLNAYPAVEGLEELEFDGIAADVYELLREPKAPNCFLYKRYKDALDEEAALALSGDEAARKSLKNRISELNTG